ncbi:MAG: hypothetical protein IPP44_00580 [Ideonella sp.]|nr:hypothetical protein [Ideonella sp.]
MPTTETSDLRGQAGRSWFWLWVLAAALFAVIEMIEYTSTRALASAISAAAWTCWAFSWYAKPFRVNFKGALGKAFGVQPIREGVPQSLWNAVTIFALVLSIVGLALKLANAA